MDLGGNSYFHPLTALLPPLPPHTHLGSSLQRFQLWQQEGQRRGSSAHCRSSGWWGRFYLLFLLLKTSGFEPFDSWQKKGGEISLTSSEFLVVAPVLALSLAPGADGARAGAGKVQEARGCSATHSMVLAKYASASKRPWDWPPHKKQEEEQSPSLYNSFGVKTLTREVGELGSVSTLPQVVQNSTFSNPTFPGGWHSPPSYWSCATVQKEYKIHRLEGTSNRMMNRVKYSFLETGNLRFGPQKPEIICKYERLWLFNV